MYVIDPARKDLVEAFRKNPSGPHGPELTLLVNCLRLMPLAERHILVCTKRGREWVLAKMPAARGQKVELLEDRVFTDYNDGLWEIFKKRYETVTGQSLAD